MKKLDKFDKVLRAGTYIYSIGTAANQVAKFINNKYFTYTVTVSEKDEVYNKLKQYLFDKQESSKSVKLFSEWQNPNWTIQKMLDSEQAQFINIKGHRVKVSSSQKEAAKSDSLTVLLRPEQLIFSAKSYAGQQAVVDFISEIGTGQNEKTARLMQFKWSSWYELSSNVKRPLDSVILKRGQKESIVADLEHFFEQEQDYVKRGIPWHRGYLFYGPPGGGKTSFAKAIADYFNLDVYYVSLSDVDKDALMTQMLSEIKPHSILLLEDIDVFSSARDRESDNKFTMSGLLNALDGIATPHGLITIMTTNHLSKIDPAVFRSGRIDIVEELSNADNYQIEELFKFFYGQPLGLAVELDISVADIMEIFKRNMNDPESAQKALLNA